ncbi:MAG: alkaline phosphatase family protein [Acidimicrobiia bacterium]
MEPLIPDYAGPCLSNVAPTILEPPASRPDWFPAAAWGATQVVLLAIDGLGFDQLAERRHLAPTLASMDGGPILTVAPSTTATALSSLTLGVPPGRHGVVGYRINVKGDVLNILRWQTPSGDARTEIPPAAIQPLPAFLGRRPPVVTRTEFAGTGFTTAHLSDVRFTGYRVPSTLVTEVRRALRSGEPFVYAYYDGIDKVAHEYGLTDFYDAELSAVDRLVADVADVLPPGATLVITSDHGQVQVGDAVVTIADEVLAELELLSGEGRFRWLHARPGHEQALAEAAALHHGARAWVRTRAQVIEDGWFGPTVSESAAARFGDVVMAAIDPVAFHDPADTGPYRLQARHGSLTAAEMRVPLLSLRA